MKEQILDILKNIRPDVDHISVDNYFEQGIFDSLDLIMIVASLDEKFAISIDGSEIIPENFICIDRIIALVERKISNN